MPSHSQQQCFLDLIYFFISSGAATADRCSANATLALACVARCTQRHRLQSYGWRCLRACEWQMVHMFERRALDAEADLQLISTLIRSNTDVRGGTLMQRVRRVLGEHGVTTHLMMLLNRLPDAAALVQREYNRTVFWFGAASLAEDETEPGEGEED